MTRHSAIESLESRIAPAVTVFHAIPDIVAGIGKTGATIDLEALVDEENGTYRTTVLFETNFTLPGETTPAVIELELFDDKAPLSVQNFLTYLTNQSYDGTFFHRIFDFGTGSGAGIDIIQAGGFDVTKITEHIPTGLTLHNEYNADDPEVQNTRGTIAMAKTAVSPNTATSEWFINLTDNSTILGAENNGGFTVFGKVTDESLAVIDAIGQAMKVNRGGALTDLPVQNYPSGGTAEPTPDQLIQIETALVIPAKATNANGHTFEVKATEPNSANVSTLLTWNHNTQTNNLTLNYVPGQTGEADVTVTIKKEGEPDATDTFRVTVLPNLYTDVSHTLSPEYKVGNQFQPGPFFVGDKATAGITLSNNGGGLAKGNVTLGLYLSEIISTNNAIDPLTFAVDENDIQLVEQVVAIQIESGESKTIPLKFEVPYSPGEKVLVNGKLYLVVAKVDTTDTDVDELFTDDNEGAQRTRHSFNLAIGTVENRVDRTLTLGDVSYTISGNGTAVFTPNENGSFSINVSGTDAKSVLKVKAARGETQDIQDISIEQTIGRVDFGDVNLLGDFRAGGGAKSITLGDLTGNSIDRTFSVNAFPGSNQKLALSFGTVTDYSLTSSMPISKLRAAAWLDTEGTTGANQIFLSGIGSVKIAGNLEASIVNSSTDRIAQIHVGETLNGVTIKTLGDIGSVKLGDMISSNLFAGLDQAPNDLADFSEGRTISSLKVTGEVSDSVIAAARFNSIVLGSVDTAAGTSTKGIYADAIKSYLRKGIGGAKLSRLNEPDVYNASGNYQVAVF